MDELLIDVILTKKINNNLNLKDHLIHMNTSQNLVEESGANNTSLNLTTSIDGKSPWSH